MWYPHNVELHVIFTNTWITHLCLVIGQTKNDTCTWYILLQLIWYTFTFEDRLSPIISDERMFSELTLYFVDQVKLCVWVSKRQNFQIGNTKIHKNSFRAMVDAATKKALSGIPLMKTKAGPRDKEVAQLQHFCQNRTIQHLVLPGLG